MSLMLRIRQSLVRYLPALHKLPVNMKMLYKSILYSVVKHFHIDEYSEINKLISCKRYRLIYVYSLQYISFCNGKGDISDRLLKLEEDFLDLDERMDEGVGKSAAHQSCCINSL